MRVAKRPTRKQAEIIRKWGLNSGNWHVFKAPVGELHIEHRHTGRRRVILDERVGR